MDSVSKAVILIGKSWKKKKRERQKMFSLKQTKNYRPVTIFFCKMTYKVVKRKDVKIAPSLQDTPYRARIMLQTILASLQFLKKANHCISELCRVSLGLPFSSSNSFPKFFRTGLSRRNEDAWTMHFSVKMYFAIHNYICSTFIILPAFNWTFF